MKFCPGGKVNSPLIWIAGKSTKSAGIEYGDIFPYFIDKEALLSLFLLFCGSVEIQ
jgi:hypothetical protein